MEVHVNLASRDYYDYLPDATIFFATVKQKISLYGSCLNVLLAGGIASYFPAVTSYKYCTAIGTNTTFAREETSGYLRISTDATTTICFARVKKKK